LANDLRNSLAAVAADEGKTIVIMASKGAVQTGLVCARTSLVRVSTGLVRARTDLVRVRTSLVRARTDHVRLRTGLVRVSTCLVRGHNDPLRARNDIIEKQKVESWKVEMRVSERLCAGHPGTPITASASGQRAEDGLRLGDYGSERGRKTDDRLRTAEITAKYTKHTNRFISDFGLVDFRFQLSAFQNLSGGFCFLLSQFLILDFIMSAFQLSVLGGKTC